MASSRYARVLKVAVVPVVGIFDEDGHLLAEHALGETSLYYPFHNGLDAILGLARKRVQETLNEEVGDGGQE